MRIIGSIVPKVSSKPKATQTMYTKVEAGAAADSLAVIVNVLQQLQSLIEGDSALLASAPDEIKKRTFQMISLVKRMIHDLNLLVGNIPLHKDVEEGSKAFDKAVKDGKEIEDKGKEKPINQESPKPDTKEEKKPEIKDKK